MIATDEQQVVAGDQRPTATLAQLAAWGEFGDSGKPGEAAGQGMASTGSFTIPDAAATARRSADGPELVSLIWITRSLPDSAASIGVCCTFAPPVSRRVAAARLSLLEGVWPALETTVRDSLGRWGGQDALQDLLRRLPVPAALLAADGTMLHANRPLSALLAADAHPARLLDGIARAATGVRSPAGGTDDVLVRLPGHSYRVRTRVIAAIAPADAPCRLVLVHPLAADAPAETPDRLDALRKRFRLTEREAEVVRLLHLGHSNVGIANALGISANTARHHTERVLGKLGVQSRGAVSQAIRDAQGEQAGLATRSDGRQRPLGSSVSAPHADVVVTRFDRMEAR